MKDLAVALRETAARIRAGETYRWTHQGSCNCGHLAQTLTRRSREAIHAAAVQKAGDWREHTIDYCPTSGLPIDHILGEMLDAGLTLGDIEHLERLSDRRVLETLPVDQRQLDYRERDDVVRYMEAWADLLAPASAPVDRAA